MRKTKKLQWERHILWSAVSVILVLLLALGTDVFSMVSHAQSQGRVTAASANIRKEANATSEVVGSATQNAVVTINHQVTASDNMVWYQIFVDANTLGYIRSDLVEITDGTTPPTEQLTTANATTTTPTTATPTPTPAVNETPATVTAVEPISANVSGGQSVRVRSNASTTSSIVANVNSGSAITVTGQATGTDGNTWYQVNFIADGSEVVGFIRSDFVTLSGALVPVSDAPAEGEGETPQEPEVTEPVAETKDYDTQLQGDVWYLLDNANAKQYSIPDLFSAVEQNAALYQESLKTISGQKIAIILLVIVAVLLAAAVAFLIFKMKESQDAAFFEQVEKETVRRRGDSASGGRRIMQTVGSEKQTGSRPAGGTRPAAGRPTGSTGAGAPAQGQSRPAGSRPMGNGGAGAPGQGQSRPAGARPVGNGGAGAPAQGQPRPAGARPVGNGGAGAPTQGQPRPAGARPVGNGGAGAPTQGQPRPAGARPAGNATAGGTTRPVGVRPGTAAQGRTTQANSEQNPGWKSKNFMTDDDEFEFEFLNWEDDEQ